MQKEYQTRAIVIFGDMQGFGSFTQRISYPDVEFLPFIRQFNGLINEFQRKTGYFVKRLGDGFMGVVELPRTNGEKRVTCVLEKVWNLTNAVNSLIAHKPTPRPEGFRSRMVCGYVWKTVGHDNSQDYLGYHVNLCEKILHVHKNEKLVIGQNMREALSTANLRRKHFSVDKLNETTNAPDGIYKEDMNTLWRVTKRK